LGESHNTVLSRILEYPVVEYATGTATDCYKYAKSYNDYSKKAFEAAESYGQPLASASWAKIEEYSRAPAFEGIINKADTFGNQQLDKLESTIHTIREEAPKRYQAFEQSIQGTAVEGALVKTVGIIDNVVDAILPANEEESQEEEPSQTDAQSLSDAASPVIKKLKNRVSKKSVLNIPAQTYNVACTAALRSANDQYKNYSTLLQSASSYILSTKQVTIQKSSDIYTISIDHIYHLLNNVALSLNSIVSAMKKLDPVEAQATLNELVKMIASSKQNVSQIIDDLHLKQKLREDTSAILSKAGDILRPVEDGYARIANSDIAALRNTCASLESAVQAVVENLSAVFQSTQNKVETKEA